MSSSKDGDDVAPGECHMCLAIPGKIIEISSDNPDSALVDVVSVRRRIDLGLLQDDRPEPGDWVLIHVGFAMSKISEQDAHGQMQTLRMMGEADAALEEVSGYGLDEAYDSESNEARRREARKTAAGKLRN
jgi:hydrogenase expression/formation protein HypC